MSTDLEQKLKKTPVKSDKTRVSNTPRDQSKITKPKSTIYYPESLAEHEANQLVGKTSEPTNEPDLKNEEIVAADIKKSKQILSLNPAKQAKEIALISPYKPSLAKKILQQSSHDQNKLAEEIIIEMQDWQLMAISLDYLNFLYGLNKDENLDQRLIPFVQAKSKFNKENGGVEIHTIARKLKIAIEKKKENPLTQTIWLDETLNAIKKDAKQHGSKNFNLLTLSYEGDINLDLKAIDRLDIIPKNESPIESNSFEGNLIRDILLKFQPPYRKTVEWISEELKNTFQDNLSQVTKFNTAFFKKTGTSLVSYMEAKISEEVKQIERKNINLNRTTDTRRSVRTKRKVEQIMTPLRRYSKLNNIEKEDLSEFVQQKRLENFHKNDETLVNLPTKLWDGITIEDLVKKVEDHLNPYLGENPPRKRDSSIYPVFMALASLRMREQNIKEFLRLYGGKNQLLNDIQEAKYLYKKSIPVHTQLDSLQIIEEKHQLFDEKDITNIEKYLNPKNITHKEVLQDKSAKLEQLMDGDLPNFSNFKPGTFIIQELTDDSETYYVVKEGDSLYSIASDMGLEGIGVQALVEINGWKSVEEDGTINFDDNRKGKLQAHQGIKAPYASVMNAPEYFHIQGGTLLKINPNKTESSFGKRTWEVHENNLDPQFLEDQIKYAFTGENGHDKNSGSLEFKIYLRGELAFLFYVELSLEGELSGSVNSDLSFELVKRIDIKAREGIRLGVFGKVKFTQKLSELKNSIELYESAEQFAVDMNHDIYKFYLENGAFIPDFVDYWDDERNQEMLQSDHYKIMKSKKKLNPDLKIANRTVEFTNQTYELISGVDYIGDVEERKKRGYSQDFRGEKDNDSDRVIDAKLVDTPLLEISYKNILHDYNVDNEGSYLTIKINIGIDTFTEIAKLISSSAELLKEGKGWGAVLGKITKKELGISDVLKDIDNLDKSQGDKELEKEAEKFNEIVKKKDIKVFGKNTSLNTKMAADGGVSMTIVLIGDSEGFFGFNKQFSAIHGYGSLTFGAEAEMTFLKFINLKAGFHAEIAISKQLHESPGTETLSYISAIYNTLRFRSDNIDIREKRKEKHKDAQEERLKLIQKGMGKDDAQKEEWKIIEKYWEAYEENNKIFNNDIWNAYKKTQKKQGDPLNKMAQKFFKPIFEAKDKTDWEGVQLMTVKTSDMIKFAKFDNPQAVLDKLDTKSYKETTFKNLEELILFNLYKKHQKHAFDYYNFTNGTEPKNK